MQMDTLSLIMIILPIILLILLIRILFGKHKSDDVSSISLDKEIARLRNGPHPDDYYLAEQRLAKIGETALPVLIGVVSNSTQPGDFRARALETAANIGGTKISEFLIRCATDPDIFVRSNAIYQLGALHIKEALPLLKELAVSDDAEWLNPGAGLISIKNAVIKAISAIESAPNCLQRRRTQRARRLRFATRGERVDPWESTKDRQGVRRAKVFFRKKRV